jgi:hypothetical protein
MRKIFGLAALLMLGMTAPAAAQSSPYPWCHGMQLGRGQAFSCGFRTFEACRDEMMANRGWCMVNPRYVPHRATYERRVRRKRARR